MKRILLVLSAVLFEGMEKNLAATSLFPGPDYVIPGGPIPEAGPHIGPEGLNYQPGSVWERPLLLGDMNDLRNQIMYHGFSISPVLIAEVMGNVSGGMRQGVIFDGVLNVGLDIDLERLTNWWTGGSIHANSLWIFGPSLSAQYVGDISNTSNIAGFNTIRLQELWFEQSFWQQRASLRAGLLAADAEFFTSSYSSLFLSGTFGAFTLVGSNLPNPPIYPEAVPGVRLSIQPTSKFYFQAGIYGGNAQSQEENNHGLNFSHRRVFRPRSCPDQSSRRAVHRSRPSGRICPSWNAPVPGPRVLRASWHWPDVLRRRSWQVLRGCAPEAAHASGLRARRSAGCGTDNNAAWALRGQRPQRSFPHQKAPG